MSAQHTPGPWRYDAHSGAIHVDDGGVEALVATTNFESVSVEQGDADGRLIAAAPELLEAAQEVLAGLKGRIDCAIQNGGPVPVFAGIAALNAAIAKATTPLDMTKGE